MTQAWPSLVAWEEAQRLPHPTKQALHDLTTHLKDDAVLKRFANLWMLEGIPAAFAEKPSDYELIRDALSGRLGVEPHCASLVGSARFGYSYTAKKWLKPFVPGTHKDASDYDFFVCDLNLTKGCITDLRTYIEHAQAKLEKADEKKAEEIRADIAERHRQIGRELFNNNVLPGDGRYPTFKLLNEAIGLVTKKYVSQLRGSKIKVRVYPDWGLAFRQNVRNLRANLHDVVNPPTASSSFPATKPA